jgi:hypothetical protein
LIDPKIVDSKTTLMDFGSPVHWINPTSAPTLSYYGINDHVVPMSQKKTLDSVLSENKVYHNLMNLPEIISAGISLPMQIFWSIKLRDL